MFLHSASEVINETIKKKDDHGRLIKSILANGEAVSDELVLQMIAEKIKSAEVAHQGILHKWVILWKIYVLTWHLEFQIESNYLLQHSQMPQ